MWLCGLCSVGEVLLSLSDTKAFPQKLPHNAEKNNLFNINGLPFYCSQFWVLDELFFCCCSSQLPDKQESTKRGKTKTVPVELIFCTLPALPQNQLWLYHTNNKWKVLHGYGGEAKIKSQPLVCFVSFFTLIAESFGHPLAFFWFGSAVLKVV